MKTFVAEKNIKLSDFLLLKYNGTLNYNGLMRLYRQKDVKVNGARVNKNVDLSRGDEVVVYYDGDLTFAASRIEVVYSDENILICVKPVKISSESFYELVKNKFASAIFTHRLDTNTRGIMFFALNAQAYGELYAGLKARSFKKFYYCVVNGRVNGEKKRLNAYLIKDSASGTVKITQKKSLSAREIITEYEVIRRAEHSTLLKVELITGRTHQIRAHLAYDGHFIIGDGKYGDERINRARKVKTQLLLSGEIIFSFSSDSLLYYLNAKSFSVDYSYLLKELF